jgi:hypothetical protein
MKTNALLTTVCALLLLGGCATQPRWESAYEDCREQVESLSDILGPAEDGDDLAAAVDSVAEEIGGAVCEAIRSVCEPEPDNEACRLVIEQYEYDLLTE